MIQQWTVSHLNPKTGPIATSFVGTNLDECRASCLGCPQLGDHNTPTRCYAWAGLVRRGAGAVFSSSKDKTLQAAFKRAPDKRAVRMGAIGDPGRVDWIRVNREVEFCRKNNAAVLAYTHHWRDLGKRAAKVFMASCDDWAGARQALKQGWCPTVIVPHGTPKVVSCSTGESFLRCPAETSKETGRGHVTCADCRLCDPTRLRNSKWSGIMFVFHGPRAPWTPERRAKAAMRRLKLAEESVS